MLICLHSTIKFQKQKVVEAGQKLIEGKQNGGVQEGQGAIEGGQKTIDVKRMLV
jgi:hypothetical protein